MRYPIRFGDQDLTRTQVAQELDPRGAWAGPLGQRLAPDEHLFYDRAMDGRRRPPARYVEQPCQRALNPVRGMPFRWPLNPYVGCVHRCTFCYVRAFEVRADRDSADGYGRSVRVKTNVATLLRTELARPSWSAELVALGTATDPYQPAEARYRLTRGCLEELARARTPVGLVTRGPMVLRDIDVLQDLAACADLTVTVSLPTLDLEVWRRTEPGTAPPRQRLRVIASLVEAGIRAGVALAPLLPGISDSPEGIAAVVAAARQAGATHLWSGVLRLPPGTREHFLASLEQDWPELLDRYRAMYARGAAAPPSVRAATQDAVETERRRWSIADRRRRPIRPLPAPAQMDLLAV